MEDINYNKQSFTPEDWTKVLESVALSAVAVMRKLTMVAAFAATLLMPASAFAAHVHAHNNVHVNRNVHVDRNALPSPSLARLRRSFWRSMGTRSHKSM